MLTGWPGAATDGFPVVLVGDDAGVAELAGGRVAVRIGWGDDLAQALGAAGPGAVVVADVEAADDAALATLVEVAATWPVVALFGTERLDPVAAALIDTDAQLLCDATLAEQVGAIAVAGTRAGSDGVREGQVREGGDESARLRRFSTDVARVAALLARLAAAQGDGVAGGEVADRRPVYDAGWVERAPVVDAQAVRQAIRARRLRLSFFGDAMFEDPAWDMLLDLFAAELEGGRVSVSSLCIAAAVAPTTALRWVGRLTDAGLFERRPDPQDRRRAFMALSARGSAAMRAYVAALARAGLALG